MIVTIQLVPPAVQPGAKRLPYLLWG